LRKEFTTGFDTEASKNPCKKNKKEVTTKGAVRNMSLKVASVEVFGLLGNKGGWKNNNHEDDYSRGSNNLRKSEDW